MSQDEQRKQLCKELYSICIQPTDTFKFENQFIKIWNYLHELIKLEKDLVPFCCNEKTQRNETALKNFSHFIQNDQVKLVHLENGQLGVQAQKNFKKGDLVFEIGETKILTLNSKIKEINKLVSSDKLMALMPNVAMSLLILKLKTESSSELALKWKPYLDVLPYQFNTPLYFSLEEIKMLQASQSFYDVLLHIRSVARQYAYLVGFFDVKKGFNELKKNFSYENYRWCVSVVTSRENEIIDQETNRPILAMIPLLEMCNHSEGEMCTEYDVNTKSAKCYANKDLERGDEVTIFYGRRNNKDMLIHNGFVCENNPFNTLSFKLGISVQDPLFNQRSSVLSLFGLSNTEKFEIFNKSETNNNDPFPTKLWFFVKVFLIKSVDELQELYEMKEKNIEKYSNQNDLRSNVQLRQFLKIRFNLFLRAHQQQQQKSVSFENDNLNSLNILFIKRFIEAEISMIKCLNDYL